MSSNELALGLVFLVAGVIDSASYVGIISAAAFRRSPSGGAGPTRPDSVHSRGLMVNKKKGSVQTLRQGRDCFTYRILIQRSFWFSKRVCLIHPRSDLITSNLYSTWLIFMFQLLEPWS